MPNNVIGGEMEITLDMLAEDEQSEVWPSFGKPNVIRCDTGRSALKLALTDWQKRAPNGRVWMPHYLCQSVVEATKQVGRIPFFYEDRPGLAHWSDVPSPQTGDLIVIVHYFGLINQPALDWLSKQRNREFFVLEDCVQAPYSAIAGRAGDYAISSLRKWWPTADGATLAAQHRLATTPLAQSDESFVSMRTFAKMSRAHQINESQYLHWIETSENMLTNAPPRHASWLAQHLLASVNLSRAVEQRRLNWQILSTELQSVGSVKSLYSKLKDGDVPLAYPILIAQEHRNPLRSHLHAQSIFCPVHWPLCKNAPPTDQQLSQSLLSIPLDQRYCASDMRRAVSHIKEFFKG